MKFYSEKDIIKNFDFLSKEEFEGLFFDGAISEKILFEFKHEIDFDNLIIKSVKFDDLYLLKKLFTLIKERYKDFNIVLELAIYYNSVNILYFISNNLKLNISYALIYSFISHFSVRKHRVTVTDDLKIFNFLIDNFDEINNKELVTNLLYSSCIFKNHQYFNKLLKNGADPFRKNVIGQDCFDALKNNRASKNILNKLIEKYHTS